VKRRDTTPWSRPVAAFHTAGLMPSAAIRRNEDGGFVLPTFFVDSGVRGRVILGGDPPGGTPYADASQRVIQATGDMPWPRGASPHGRFFGVQK
jgi:hypothetical protein